MSYITIAPDPVARDEAKLKREASFQEASRTLGRPQAEGTDLPTPEEREWMFLELAEEWRRTHRWSWRTDKLVDNPAYQEIMTMSWEAVPFIIRELEKSPDHWFYALMKITGENPVPPEHAGSLDLMAKDWIRWWRNRKKT